MPRLSNPTILLRDVERAVRNLNVVACQFGTLDMVSFFGGWARAPRPPVPSVRQLGADLAEWHKTHVVRFDGMRGLYVVEVPAGAASPDFGGDPAPAGLASVLGIPTLNADNFLATAKEIKQLDLL